MIRSVLPDVSHETLRRLDRHAALLATWSRRINLVGSSTENALWTRHFADSAQIVALKPQARRWIDLGSGAGFPGMVVAILLGHLPDTRVDLIESNRKKAAFLSAVRAECAPNAIVHAGRIEEVLPSLPRPDIVTARALASLPALIAMTAGTLTGSTRGLFHKGRGYQGEVAESRDRWAFDLVEHPSVTDPDAAILEIGDVRARRAAAD